MDESNMLTKATGSSLGQLAEDAWERWGDQSITVFEGRRWTMRELGERARHFAGGLQKIGVEPGDRVVVCMANCVEVGISYNAIWRIGAVTTPVLFLLSEDELRHILIDSEAKAIITTPEFAPKVFAAVEGIQPRPTVIVTGPKQDGAESFEELEASPEVPLVVSDPTELAALLYTGGTTGRSKGVMISHNALSSAAWAATVGGDPAETRVSLLPLPLAHVYGLMVSTMALHATQPATSILMRWFDPVGWLKIAQDEKVNIGPMVPAMLRSLLDQPLEDYDLSALSRLSSGSAPLAGEVIAQLKERLPNVEISEGYGCTETSALVSSSPMGDGRVGSVGTPAHGVEVRILDLDGTEVEQGQDGEICVRSPSLMTGYWKAPEATAEALRDGWFHTGDVGRIDEHGHLYIVDRIKDLIIRGGFNVYPRDVEEVLMAHPAIANTAVIGRPDERSGEEVVAFVQLHEGQTATEDEIRSYAKEHLSAVKYPRDIHIVEQIPLTSVGKLDRKVLRASLA